MVCWMSIAYSEAGNGQEAKCPGDDSTEAAGLWHAIVTDQVMFLSNQQSPRKAHTIHRALQTPLQ